MYVSVESFILRKVAIWGFGREGQAALRFLRRMFPEKKIGLILSPEEAASWDFGDNPLLEVVTAEPSPGTFGPYQIIIKSPGISPYKYAKAMEWAYFRGTRFVSGTGLWFAYHRQDKTIAITGTKGKSTTSALTASLLRQSGARTLLAGNIGLPLLDVMDPSPEPDYWVIELSSYQTADFEGHPAIASVLNLSPEHLDWHGDEDRYYQDKLRICANGNADLAVLNAADARLMEHTAHIERRALFNHPDFWHARGNEVWHGPERVIDLSHLALTGAHNASNVAAAFTMVEAFGHEPRGLLDAVRDFKPLPHRLTRLGERDGVAYVDDSISTTPEATIAALRSLSPRPSVVIVGGYDRGLAWDDFVRAVAVEPPTGIVTVGQNGPRIFEQLDTQIRSMPPGQRPRLASAADLPEALSAAQRMVPASGVILLSPGAPSFDQFKDYAERGREFARLAGFEVGDDSIEGLGQ